MYVNSKIEQYWAYDISEKILYVTALFIVRHCWHSDPSFSVHSTYDFFHVRYFKRLNGYEGYFLLGCDTV
jgi:hypothetical protein